jgi:hypothetical protein
MDDTLAEPAAYRGVRTLRQFEWVACRKKLIIRRAVQPLECPLGMPSKTLVSIANGIAHDDCTTFGTKRRIEAKPSPSPPASISGWQIPRLMRKRRGHSTLGSRVERDAPEGINVVEENAPTGRGGNELSVLFVPERNLQNPSLLLLVKRRPVRHLARSDCMKAANASLDGRR